VYDIVVDIYFLKL